MIIIFLNQKGSIGKVNFNFEDWKIICEKNPPIVEYKTTKGGFLLRTTKDIKKFVFE